MICGNIFKFITNHNVNRWIIALASSFVHVICARCCFCCCRWFYCWFVASVGGGGVVGGVTKLAANHFATFIMHSCNIYSHEFIYMCVYVYHLLLMPLLQCLLHWLLFKRAAHSIRFALRNYYFLDFCWIIYFFCCCNALFFFFCVFAHQQLAILTWVMFCLITALATMRR